MSKILAVTAKTLRETWRQPKNLAIILGLPLAFMLIFGFAFGSDDPSTYDLAVSNADDGEIAAAYVSGLRNLTYGDDTPIFQVTDRSEEEAREALARGDHDVVLVIPANFSANAVPRFEGDDGAAPFPPLTQPQAPPAAEGAVATLIGDPSRQPFQASSQILAGYSARFAESVSGARPAVSTYTEAVTAAELTDFDYIAPGLMVFAILNLMPLVAATLARESETKTLERIRMSPTGAITLLLGVSFAQLLLACVSLALMFATADLMGFHNQGSYVDAYVFALGAAVAVIGMGLVIASFARTQQEAANFGVLVSVPASFLSGSFFPIPPFVVNGFSVYDVLPTTHAVVALRQMLTLGRPLAEVTDELAALAGLAAVFFVVGVVLYARMRLRAE